MVHHHFIKKVPNLNKVDNLVQKRLLKVTSHEPYFKAIFD